MSTTAARIIFGLVIALNLVLFLLILPYVIDPASRLLVAHHVTGAQSGGELFVFATIALSLVAINVIAAHKIRSTSRMFSHVLDRYVMICVLMTVGNGVILIVYVFAWVMND